MPYTRTIGALKILLCCFSLGCAHSKIPGTEVRDTQENREIVDLLETMRKAVEIRNLDGVRALISPDYFEDLGTADPRDDYGYVELTSEILPESFKRTLEMYVTFRVFDVVVEGDKAHADIQYSSRARLSLPDGETWDSHQEFNRVELRRTPKDTWLIVAGL